MFTLGCEMLVKESIREVFAFFADPSNLARLTPPSLDFRILPGAKPEMRAGAEIDYRIRVMGIPMYWKTLITEYEPPFHFVDEQAKGPYRYWRHTHTFRPVPEGTIVGDLVEYTLPFGMLGAAAHALFVKRQLLTIFRFRQQALRRVFNERTVGLAEPAIAER